MGIPYTPKSREHDNRYLVSVDDYIHYQRNGYLIVRDLLSKDDIAELYDLAERTRLGSPRIDGGAARNDDPLKREFAEQTRVHMVSRRDAAAERGLLHPRILDVTEALIGPDIYALQSMMFLNPPGRGGQGWHQDSYYIKTHPDTMLGAWIALEDADEENGCLWVVPGSNHEPIYPPEGQYSGSVHAADAFKDLHAVENVSHLDDEANTLSRVVAKYPPPIPVPLRPGDVLFSIRICCTARIRIGRRIGFAVPMYATIATPGPGFPGIMTATRASRATTGRFWREGAPICLTRSLPSARRYFCTRPARKATASA